MEREGIQRKLAAILSADVAGYSRMMSEDEAGTLATLKAHRAELIDPTVEKFGGRIVKLMGDGALVEFPSVVDAVECAIAIQNGMAERNAGVPDELRIVFRIGINVGDIIVERDDIYGDGVNVAARLEGLAEPGGFCVSGKVYEEVGNKLDAAFEDLGPTKVKNIPKSVQVYRWSMAADTAQRTARAKGALPLSEKPSIAVLPFDNMSGDQEQEYFADGLTEDIITELSRFQSFFVIARHSTFFYKGKQVTMQDVGRDLGVHYVVEGSVRKAGSRMRVVVQLIDANSGSHIWAERYDHDVTDIFDLQDEVTRSIVAAIPGQLESADIDRIRRKRPEDLAVYDYVLRGKMHHHRGTKDDNAEALRLLDKAIKMDPGFSEAYAWKACTLGQALALGFGDDKEDLFARDVAACEKALSLDENNFECHWIMCEVRMMVARLDDAELHHRKAFALNPNDPRVLGQRCELLTWLGRPDEGAEWARMAMRLDPFNAARRAHLLGRALYVAGKYAEAIEAFRQVRAPSFKQHAEIAACHAQLGAVEKAGQHVGEVLQLKPDFSIADHAGGLPFEDPLDGDRYRDGFVKAGLPE
ncbi:MAG TPA: adenylate/guanylate cyclase domain-containing protein [Thermohalobaculum sp.]|nr:adenylate/guanylate cyclase domain-containing protein [Thermohalobaculum sp.]